MTPHDPSNPISVAAAALGARGGRAGVGASKRRPLSSAQAREMSRARWEKARSGKQGVAEKTKGNL